MGVAEATLGLKLSGQEGGIWPSKADACPASGYDLTVPCTTHCKSQL